VNELITPPPQSPAPASSSSFWTRFRTTFGPALVGVLGGTLTAGIGCASLLTVLKNCSATYAKYPSLQAPWLAQDFQLHPVILIPLVVFAFIAPFAVGYATAWLVRPKDRWEAVSAGLTTAMTASGTAYLLWIGWMVTLAMVIVPSINDLALFGNSTQAPTVTTAKPSDVLTGPYPDLITTPADERGGLFFPKIVSDQVVGSAYGVWYGVILSIAIVGVPSFGGTLAATWLLGRGGSWCSKLISYTELTVATTVPLGLLIFAVVPIGFMFDEPMAWLRLAALTTVSAVVVLGVFGRWNWPIRFVSAFTWAIVLMGVGIGSHQSGPITYAAYAVYSGFAFLVLQKWITSRGLPIDWPR
jgi:hypothetical protein